MKKVLIYTLLIVSGFAFAYGQQPKDNVKKTAFVMNCPVGTVKSHILRSREKLASYFKNSDYER
jgi:hypothetical protein